MEEFKILDIKMHKCSMEAILSETHRSIIQNKRLIFCWNNPETIYESINDKDLKNYFNNISNYNFVDGAGTILIKKIFGNYVGPRNTGTDYLPRLCELSDKYGFKLYFLGSEPGVCEKAIQYFSNKFQKVKIVGSHHGFFSIEQEETIIDNINNSGADVLGVFLGCPRQEQFIQRNISKLKPSVVYGGGGGLDYYSGVVKRAPNLIIKLGLEFIWRLFQDFSWKRIKRQSIYPMFVILSVLDELKKIKNKTK